MDALDGSDANESQATQLLQELLEGDTDSSRKPSESSALKTHFVHSNEISSDSLPSSRTSNSLPQYHFHGLASTQTQTQQYEDDEQVNEGSQKENIGASNACKEVGRSIPSPASRPPSPHASSSKNAQAKASSADNRPGVLSTNPKGTSKKASVAVTFQSPQPKAATGGTANKPAPRSPYKPTIQTTSRYKVPRRPPSRTDSQDSFAFDPDNPEEQLLAKSEKFAVPLSELGRSPSPVRNVANARGGMFAYPTTGRKPVALSPPSGRVLVEATPSHSGSSQSQDEPRDLSQQLEATQLTDHPEPENQGGNNAMAVDKDGNGSGYESSEPSSSYRRFLDGERDPEPEAEPTQPSTQVDDSNMAALDAEATPWSNQPSGATGASTSDPRSVPKSLLSLVKPGNQWRYQKYAQRAQAIPSAQASSRPMEQSNPPPPFVPSVEQETQPSFPAQPSRTAAKLLPTPNLSNARGSSHANSPIPIDSMEIVPDSEPSRSDYATNSPRKPVMQTSKIHHPPATVPPSKNHRVVQDEDIDMDEIDAQGKNLPQEVEQQEEEDEEEEDDIPLAAMRKQSKVTPGRKPVNKGKGKLAQEDVAPVKTVAKGKVVAPVAPQKEKKPTMKAIQKAIGRSWETSEIPSSLPEQDIVDGSRNTRTAKPNNAYDLRKKGGKNAPRSKQTSKSASAVPKSRGHQAAATRKEGEESDDELLMRQSDNDDGTEPADEEYENGDSGEPSRKRKRITTKAPVAGKNTRMASKRPKRNTATPATRQIKKLRTAISTGSRASIAQATRVFALWKQDCHYYPGVVHSTNTNSDYMVKFDDETDAWVTLDQMRLCKMYVGDDVLVANRTRASRVVNVDDEGTGSVQVNIDDSVEDVEIRHLRIANKTILYAWKDRILTPESIVTVVKPVKTNLSPSPSKMSMFSVPPVLGNRKKVLAKTGLIVTLSAANGNWEKEKESVMNAVKNSGGFVIDDLATIIRMEGKHSNNNNRYIIKKSDVQWVGNDEIERLFLVADDPNQKPKFLIALALGIPCLSTSWLRESVDCGDEREWFGYMLPQGYSAVLHARPSQQVDVDWGNSVHQLKDIMSNTVACKLFADKTILCVGPEMVPQPKGKRRAGVEEKAQEAMNAVPRIILAMGAECVESVTEARYATMELSQYDYLVIREPGQYVPEFSECENTVHWNWVKECLIASRYVPLPSWTTEYSQET